MWTQSDTKITYSTKNLENPDWMAHILVNNVTAVWFMYPFELLCSPSHEKVIRWTVWYKYHIKSDQKSSN